jgi:hypothetical protein
VLSSGQFIFYESQKSTFPIEPTDGGWPFKTIEVSENGYGLTDRNKYNVD